MAIPEVYKEHQICVNRWEEKLVASLESKNIENAALYAGAISNEYHNLYTYLLAENRRLAASP